jgi:hypothetical protein
MAFSAANDVADFAREYPRRIPQWPLRTDHRGIEGSVKLARSDDSLPCTGSTSGEVMRIAWRLRSVVTEIANPGGVATLGT